MFIKLSRLSEKDNAVYPVIINTNTIKVVSVSETIKDNSTILFTDNNFISVIESVEHIMELLVP